MLALGVDGNHFSGCVSLRFDQQEQDGPDTQALRFISQSSPRRIHHRLPLKHYLHSRLPTLAKAWTRMLASSSRSLVVACLSAATTLGLASAHTWLDCLDHDHSVVLEKSSAWVFGGSKGNGVCEGHIRGYAGRGDADINTKNTYKIERAKLSQPGIPLCQFSHDQGYGSWRKALTAKPGDTIYFGYLPNGHVSKDKWARTTQYGVYSSGLPNVELSFTTNFDESKLVNGSSHSFDDLNCGETYDRSGNPSHRAGDHIPCVGHMTIPRDAASGRRQFVWAWKFYTDSTDYSGPKDFIDFLYTSCFDVDVQQGGAAGTGSPGYVSGTMGDAVASEAETQVAPRQQESATVPTATPAVTAATPTVAPAVAAIGGGANNHPNRCDGSPP